MKPYLRITGDVEVNKFWEQAAKWQQTQKDVDEYYLVTPADFETMPAPIEFGSLSSEHPWFQMTCGCMKFIFQFRKLQSWATGSLRMISRTDGTRRALGDKGYEQYTKWFDHGVSIQQKFVALYQFLEQQEKGMKAVLHKAHVHKHYGCWFSVYTDWLKQTKTKHKGKLPDLKRGTEMKFRIPKEFARWCFDSLSSDYKGINTYRDVIISHMNYHQAQFAYNYFVERGMDAEEAQTQFKKKIDDTYFYSKFDRISLFHRQPDFIAKMDKEDRAKLKVFMYLTKKLDRPSLRKSVSNWGRAESISYIWDDDLWEAFENLRRKPSSSLIYTTLEVKQLIKIYVAMEDARYCLKQGSLYWHGLGSMDMTDSKMLHYFKKFKTSKEYIDNAIFDAEEIKSDYALAKRGHTADQKGLALELAQAQRDQREAQDRIMLIQAKLENDGRPLPPSLIEVSVTDDQDEFVVEETKQTTTTQKRKGLTIGENLTNDPSIKGVQEQTEVFNGAIYKKYYEKLGGEQDCSIEQIGKVTDPQLKLNRKRVRDWCLKNDIEPSRGWRVIEQHEVYKEYIHHLFKEHETFGSGRAWNSTPAHNVTKKLKVAYDTKQDVEKTFRAILQNQFNFGPTKQDKHIDLCQEWAIKNKTEAGRRIGQKNVLYPTVGVAKACHDDPNVPA